MRNITHLVVHCSATSPTATVEAIQRYWREVQGWKSPGYHVIVKANGEAVRLADDTAVTNGVAGHNATCLHVCYIGGVVELAGKQVPMDTRTKEQKATLLDVLRAWKAKYPKAVIQGHRDFLVPGPKWKDCPSFAAKEEYRGL